MHGVLAALLVAGIATSQVPKPFPKPGEQGQPPVAQPAPPPAVPPAGKPGASQPGEPAEGSLGVPIYPTAQFIASYDAGRGQRYYLYGTTSSFAEIVQYYRSVLKQRGDLVFDEPPIHQFDIGRFREETMAFPPSVTVKDYTWGGGAGYLVPRRGAPAVRFPTIIQVVPNPPGAPR